MHLLKGRNWVLSIHSYKHWKNEMRNPKDLPKIPYYRLFMDLPYGPYPLRDKKVTAHGTYLFPFAFRYVKEVSENHQ